MIFTNSKERAAHRASSEPESPSNGGGPPAPSHATTRLLELSDDAFFVRDAADRITYWNKAASELYGYSREEALGQVIHKLLRTEFPAPPESIKDQVRRDGCWTGELVHTRKDGTEVVVLSHWAMDLGPHGRNSGCILQTNRAITQQERTEQALRESEERFRIFVMASSGAVYRMSPDWSEMRLLQGKDFIADTKEPSRAWLDKYIHPDDQQNVLAVIKEAIRTKSIFELEHRIRRRDGTLGWTFSRAVPLLGAGGQIVEWFGAASDITKRKWAEQAFEESQNRLCELAERLEAEVRARTEQLEQRNAELLKQAAQVRDLSVRLMRTADDERRHIARELHDSAGQVLSALGMSLDIVLKRAREHSPELVEGVEEAREMVQGLTREIRTMSYLLYPPFLDETGLSDALNHYIAGLKQRSPLDLKLELSGDLGRLQRDMELTIFRIVQECLTNIHRHSGSKDAVIRLARSKESVSVEVHDHGSGMPPERLLEIQSHGSGVGIRGIRERVHHFRGEMKIESDGGGTRVTVVLPAAMQHLEQQAGIQQDVQPRGKTEGPG